MNDDAAKKFLSVMRGEIANYDDSHDKTEPCRIMAVNKDGTYNIALESDPDGEIINNILNASSYDYKVNDMAFLYKVRNQIAQSFLIGATKAANATTKNVQTNVNSGGATTVISSSSSGSVSVTSVDVSYSNSLLKVTVDGKSGQATIDKVDQAATANYAQTTGDSLFSAGAGDVVVLANGVSNSSVRVNNVNMANWATDLVGSNRTPEQPAEMAYSITNQSSDILPGAGSVLPTAAAVYGFASQGKSINVNIPASGLYPLVASNTSTAGQVYLGMNVGTYINMADGSITSSAFHGNADSATTAKDYSSVGGIATQFALDNVAINNVNLSVSDATVTFTNAAGISKAYAVNNVAHASTATTASDYDTSGTIYSALQSKVYDVAWDSTYSNLYVYNHSYGTNPKSIASTEPQQEAQTAYSIIDDLSVQPSANSIPTALAVWNATLTASHINVSAPIQGNFSLVGVTGVSTQANLYTDPAVYLN
jgi:hypothetical protein